MIKKGLFCYRRGLTHFQHLLTGSVISLVFLCQLAFAETLHVTLLQLNDVYKISPDPATNTGGLARIMTLKKSIQAKNPNTFFILAGDTLSPSVESNLFKGSQMVALWNHLGLSLACLGNHEFDFGPAVLEQRISESHFPWLAANVFSKKSCGNGLKGLQPYTVKEVHGVKIGFLGLITPETAESSFPGNALHFAEPLSVLEKTIAQMKADGVNLIVAVTHQTLAADKKLAQQFGKELTLIMGGHEHTLLQSIANGVPVFKVGSDARHLGKIDLFIDTDTKKLDSMDWNILPVNATVAEDVSTQALVNMYQKKVNLSLGKVLGQTDVPLNALQKDNRSKETNLGNWITDTFRNMLHTDIALINGGSIRSNKIYSAGPLTKRDLVDILPFGNTVLKLEISGKTLKSILEHSVSLVNQESSGRFLQISGFSFSYQPGNPTGQRVVTITIDGKALKPEQTLTVATTSYLAKGGNGFTELKAAKRLESKTVKKDASIIEKALQEQQSISPTLSNRITQK